MGGLVFSPTASRLQSELNPQQCIPTLASRVRSANDLVGMLTGYAKDDRVGPKYDFMSPDYAESSTSSRDVTRNGSCNLGWVDKLGSFGSDKELSSFPNRLQGGSLSDSVQQHKEQHYSEETLHESATSRRVPMNGDSQNSDKNDWDLELVTSSSHENPADSVSPKGMEHETETKVHLKILLAEDNAINQKVASRQLQKHGHKVTIVGDGQQALDAVCAQHNAFDLVLMDVQVHTFVMFASLNPNPC
jgi:CheY-like chemotaxis protein